MSFPSLMASLTPPMMELKRLIFTLERTSIKIFYIYLAFFIKIF